MSDMREELDLSIDENNLVNEWNGQANTMLDYGVRLADAMLTEDEAKAALALTDARLNREIRAAPDDYGLAKATESTVPNAVAEQPEHATAVQELNEAKYETRILKAAVEALGNRKSALQGMTDLFLRQWFADPRSREQPEELRTATRTGPMTKTITGRRNRRSKKKE